MNKLQLYITKTTHVFKTLFSLNPHEDVTRHVKDIRDAVEKISYDPEEKHIFYMLSSTFDGVYITVIRTIPPQAGAHLAAWIFVPNGLEIGDAELEHVVRVTTRKVSNPEVSTDDVAELREVFGVEYPCVADPPVLSPSTSRVGRYAWRPYGGSTGLTLKDYCGRGRWQQSYLPYYGVLLVDQDLECNVAATCIDRFPLGEPAVILPPERTDEGFTAHIFGQVLDRPFAGTLGAKLEVTWRRPGFEDVCVEQIIDTLEFTPSQVSTDKALKTISMSSFYVTSQKTREELHDCAIRVNGQEITGGGRSFTTDELSQAAVLVSCEGYFAFSGVLDLASTTRALIQLQEQRKIYRFELPVASSDLGAPIKFEVRARRNLTSSPIDGYSLTDEIQEGTSRVNHLVYNGGINSLPAKLIYAAIGLVIGVVLMFCVNKCSSSGDSTLAPAANPDSIVRTEVPTVVVPPTTPPAAEVKKDEPQEQPAEQAKDQSKTDEPVGKDAAATSEKSIDEAIKYLDSNKIWSREEMEKYPALRGLYDDMNNYRIDRLIDTWGPKLAKSESMGRVAKHSKLGRHKKKPEGTYNKEGDTRISVQSFLNRIDP